MSIISVVGTIQDHESVEIDILKAQFRCGKNDLVRGIIRYALEDPEKLTKWLWENPDIWRGYKRIDEPKSD